MSRVKPSKEQLAGMTPQAFREITRRGEWVDRTDDACNGYAQANLVCLPKEFAFEFLLFCNRNPRPCPVIEVTEPGDIHAPNLAPHADLRTDLPRYRVWKDGELIDEPLEVTRYWRDDLVSFLIGCSLSFESSLRAANIEFRSLGVFTSNVQSAPAGRFKGPIAVSGRLVKGRHNAIRAIQISSRLTAFHGPPIHVGDPETIGIKDIYHADIIPCHIDVPRQPDEILLWWGCGVTPQLTAKEARPSLMITHYPGHMLVTDRLTEELATI